MTKKNSLLRQWHGPLTADLVLHPGRFGLGHVPARLNPDATTTLVCGFCSTGCGLNAHLKNGAAVNVSPATDYPVNLGMACPKGWESLACLEATDRATVPLLRDSDGSLREVGWSEAMNAFTSRFKEILSRHGRESIAFLSTGQICTEELALLGAVFKFGMGGLHCDSNTRQCMATAHVAYKQSFGFDAPPFTYADFEQSDTLVFIGANPCIAHPILWQRVLRNPGKPRIIVVDPRRTETAMNATQHLALKPKSDLVLLYGIAHLFIENGWIDRSFVERNTTGFEGFAEFVRAFTPDKTAHATGISATELRRFAETIYEGRAVSFWWTMGVNQGHEATRTAQAIINLALMTGNIGRPGTGANSITGQCNAMGSRIFSNVTNLMGGRDFLDPRDRAEVARILEIPESTVPSKNSWAYDQIVQGIEDGRIKGLWVIATNSAHSWVDQNRFEKVLDKLEFLVVQDLFTTTETARRAHLVLPAAGWGEKEGTFINSERRIGLIKKVARAPGQALSDFNIFRLVAEAWGCGDLFRRWHSPEAAFHILKRLSVGRPCDFSGIADYSMLDRCGGIQWPWPAGMARDPEPERRLFTDGTFFHPDGRAKFLHEQPRPVPEPVDAEFPFVLLTGRGTSAQWHTNTRTGKSGLLRRLYPGQAYVEINPADAKTLGLRSNTKVAVISRRGRVECSAFVTSIVQPGQVFIPMHYAIANRLTASEFDPHSRQPSYKYCAVRIEPVGRCAAD